MRSNVLVIFMLMGAMLFTLFSVIAWVGAKRIAAIVLAVFAAFNIALAIQFLQNYYNR